MQVRKSCWEEPVEHKRSSVAYRHWSEVHEHWSARICSRGVRMWSSVGHMDQKAVEPQEGRTDSSAQAAQERNLKSQREVHTVFELSEERRSSLEHMSLSGHTNS